MSLCLVVEPSFVYPATSSDESEAECPDIFRREKHDPSEALLTASKNALAWLNKEATSTKDDDKDDAPCTPS